MKQIRNILALTAAITFLLAACDPTATPTPPPPSSTVTVTDTPAPDTPVPPTDTPQPYGGPTNTPLPYGGPTTTPPPYPYTGPSLAPDQAPFGLSPIGVGAIALAVALGVGGSIFYLDRKIRRLESRLQQLEIQQRS